MSTVLIVGNIIKDVYLRLDEDQNGFEQDAKGVNWLDFAFDGSSYRFFSRVAIFGGAAISLEVLARFEIDTKVADAPISFSAGQLVIDYLPEVHRYILCKGDEISYLSSASPQPTVWKEPASPPDWIFIDRSAVITQELSEQILSYLNKFSNTRLAIFVSKRTNMAADFVKGLVDRAALVFADIETKVGRPVFLISKEHIQFGNRRVAWGLSEKHDLMTDLSAHSIIAASVLGAVVLGKSVKEALLLARANIELATLNGAVNIKRLEESIVGEDYRVEKVDGGDDQETELRRNARALVGEGKGILAADESGGSIHKKFEGMGIEDNDQRRRDYRNIFFTTPDLEKYVNGVILFDETARQKADDGTDFVSFLAQRGVIPGIKVDQGLEKFEGSEETWTKGLEGLPERLKEYYDMGARFAKWRAAFEICDGMPSQMSILKNTEILAQYASDAQAAGIVPIVEPEVVYDGDYSIEQSAEVTGRILDELFDALAQKRVDLRGCILKVNMVIGGKKSERQSTPEEVGKATAAVLKEHVPGELAGVVFLSGGQGMEQATTNLQEVINGGPFPWPVTFSFARALQDAALNVWRGDNANADAAREAFRRRLVANCEALVKRD